MRALIEYPNRDLKILVEDDRSIVITNDNGEPTRLSPEEADQLIRQLARSVL